MGMKSNLERHSEVFLRATKRSLSVEGVRGRGNDKKKIGHVNKQHRNVCQHL